MKSREALRQIELLESEMKLIQDNINRVKDFVKDEQNIKWQPYTSHVFGELKHRLVAFKTRATVINKLSTTNLFR
jgi:hypothetical protein